MIYAATGHRPDKLRVYARDEVELDDKLFNIAERYLSREWHVDEVISGMALGWDTAWAEAALALSIPLTCAIPFDGQHLKWTRDQQYDYNAILARAKKVVFVCKPGYEVWKFHKRNEWMVDHADRVVAMWSGAAGGTANCVKFALKHKPPVPVENLWPKLANGA